MINACSPLECLHRASVLLEGDLLERRNNGCSQRSGSGWACAAGVMEDDRRYSDAQLNGTVLRRCWGCVCQGGAFNVSPFILLAAIIHPSGFFFSTNDLTIRLSVTCGRESHCGLSLNVLFNMDFQHLRLTYS